MYNTLHREPLRRELAVATAKVTKLETDIQRLIQPCACLGGVSPSSRPHADDVEMGLREETQDPSDELRFALMDLPDADLVQLRAHTALSRAEVHLEMLVRMRAEARAATEEALFQAFLRWCQDPKNHKVVQEHRFPVFSDPSMEITLADIRKMPSGPFRKYRELRTVYRGECEKQRLAAEAAHQIEEAQARERYGWCGVGNSS
jgi:hypothetical protein